MVSEDQAVLENGVLRGEWKIGDRRVTRLTVENKHSGQIMSIHPGHLPQVLLADGRDLDLASLQPEQPVHQDGNAIVATFVDKGSGLTLHWSAQLNDHANAIIQTLQVTASVDTHIKELLFIDTALPDAQQIGEVDGSVVVCGDIFMGVEHPLAKNLTYNAKCVRCALLLDSVLKAGQSRIHTSMIGVVPPGQLRRGFLYYLEQRRIHPYRQFLHYNNWFDVLLSRQVERITEPECLDVIEYYGRELVEKRGVKMEAFVWDDGWDDFNTLWDFHKGFPAGFKNLNEAAKKYGVAQGVWMSPNGGYARAKDSRLAYGKPLGYETNEHGYAMGGANYRKAFQDVCLKMMREHGVVFFKFDGMGDGGNGTGTTTGALSNDIHAILELSRDLHREKPDLYISATAGTWASPFWLLYADNVWRQGGDSGHHGAGDTRQQWITYRDMFCYNRVVKASPLYPLNSLMLHGIIIGNRPGRAPAAMVLDEKSVADEIWTFFGSGTCLQELYITPQVMSETMTDHLADAAKWSRANSDILIDTHWVGGSPAEAEVYGWASWQAGKGILVLRNPSGKEQHFSTTIKAALELPDHVQDTMALHAVYPRKRKLPTGTIGISQPIVLHLQPFEVVVMELLTGNQPQHN
jgi:hypothetical protein